MRYFLSGLDAVRAFSAPTYGRDTAPQPGSCTLEPNTAQSSGQRQNAPSSGRGARGPQVEGKHSMQKSCPRQLSRNPCAITLRMTVGRAWASSSRRGTHLQRGLSAQNVSSLSWATIAR